MNSHQIKTQIRDQNNFRVINLRRALGKLLTLLIFVFSVTSHAVISKNQFSEVTKALLQAYPDFTIVVNNQRGEDDIWWDQEARHASYSQITDSLGKVTHFLFYFGGLARMPQMTMEGTALILCHELGHGLGGAPYKINSHSSVEGQADYFATRYCLPKVLEKLPLITEPAPQDPLTVCTSELCRHSFVGIQSDLAAILFNNPNQDAQFDKNDPSIAEDINTNSWYYPSNQCRLDTLIAGALGRERPRCWWKPLAQ